jgi:AcrR family transcriptional regulator
MTVSVPASSIRRSPGRPRSAAAHRAILDATIQLLSEVGFAATTVEAVAARAGVGKATVYRRWPSKVPLVIEAMDTRAIEQLPLPQTGSVRGDLTEFLIGLAETLSGPDGRLVAPLLAEISRNEVLAEAFRRDLVAPRRAVMEELLREGTARGELRPDLDVDLALDALGGTLFQRLLILGEPVDRELVERLVDQLLQGIGVHSAG